MRCVHISDVHNRLAELEIPEGDVLIISGDAICRGTEEEYIQFNDELGTLPHRYVITIGGNHDPEDEATARAILSNAIYLVDQGVTINGVSFWGAPWIPGSALNFGSFALEPGCQELSEHWSKIPDGVDVLITHTPPAGTLDTRFSFGRPIGCQSLARYLAYMDKPPKVHCFGHVHEGYGSCLDLDSNTLYLNGAIDGKADRGPHVFDIDAGGAVRLLGIR